MEQALVIASIIVGVAISDQVLSLHRLLRSRAPVRWHWAQPAFAVLVLLLNVMIWWSVASGGEGPVTIGAFMPVLVELILLALLTVSSLPDHIDPEGIDLADYYQQNRVYQWFVLALALAWYLGVDIVQAVQGGQSAFALLSDRVGDVAILAVMIGMAFVRRWWLVALGLAIMMLGPIGWLSRSAG